MRRATRRLPAALALACAVASPLAAAETVTFAFAPPTDRAWLSSAVAVATASSNAPVANCARPSS